MEYRWYIGKVLNTDVNLINFTAGRWAAVAGGTGGGFAFTAPNEVTHSTVVAPPFVRVDAIETIANIFTPGETYQVSFEFDSIVMPSVAIAKTYIGDFTLKKWECWNRPGLYVFDAYCRSGRKMRISADGACILSNLFVYPYEWMPVLESNDSPVLSDALQFSIKRSQKVSSIFNNVIEGVVFYGASYERLQVLAQSLSNEVPVKIQARQSQYDAWQEVYTGFIYIKDVEWDTKNRTATVDIEDNGTGTMLLKAMDKEINISYTDGRQWSLVNPYFVDIVDGVDCHRPDDGTYPGTFGALETIRVDRLLNNLLLEATDLRVGLSSATLIDAAGWNNDASINHFAGYTTRKLDAPHNYSQIERAIITVKLADVLTDYFKFFCTFSYLSKTAIANLVCEKWNDLVVDSGIIITGVNDMIINGIKSYQAIQTGFYERDVKGNTGIVMMDGLDNYGENIYDISTRLLAGNTNEQRLTAVVDILENQHWYLFQGGYGSENKNADKVFLIEYYFVAGFVYNSTQDISTYVYNPRFEPVQWYARHADHLPNMDRYLYPIDTNFAVYYDDLVDVMLSGGLNFIYKCEFSAPITVAQLNTITNNPYAFLRVQSNNINPLKNTSINDLFIIEDVTYNYDTKIAQFKGYMT